MIMLFLKNITAIVISLFFYFHFFYRFQTPELIHIDTIVLLSDFQREIGCATDFSENCDKTTFKYIQGAWKLNLTVPAGKRKIKIMQNGTVYGQKGLKDGSEIILTLERPTHIQFLYDANAHILSIAPYSLEERSSSFPPVPISITLDDTLVYDPNLNMLANPADSIRYTMILKNQSGSSMIGVNLTRNGDPNTTMDPNFLKASPLAFNDTFTYDVHPKMVIAGLGLLANDYDLNDPLPNPPFNANLTVVRVNSMPLGGAIPTIGGGTVTVMTDGSFSYDSTNTNGATTDFFQYTVLDQDGFYDSAMVLIQFNEPPLIASNIPATDTICAFEQRDTFLMTSAFSISDDETVIASAKVEICTNYLATEDTLIPGSLPGGITSAWMDGSGILMLMGNASLADYETAIEGIQYLNQAEAPNTSIREICITVYDGIANSNQVTRELKVKPLNDCPVAVRDTVSILENNNITMFDVLANDTDLESNMLSVTKINGGMSLSMINISGGTINSLATNGILNFSHTTGFTGLDSLSAGEMFFTRFEYSMSDGSCGDSDSVIIKITGLNDAPLIASNLSATDSICAFEMQDTFLVTAAFTLLDDEDNTDSAFIQICNNYLNSEDTLITGALSGGIMATWNEAMGTLKLHGSTTKANYETAIEAIQYLNSNNSPNTNARRICITIHDGSLISNQVTRELKIKPVNDCPTAMRDTLFITENGSTVAGNVITNDTDPENNTLTVSMVNAGGANTNLVINGGTFNIATSGVANFTHTSGSMGLDTLNLDEMFFARAQYTITDGACTNTDSVIVKVTGINDAPIADSNAYAVIQTSSIMVTAPGIMTDDDDIDHGSSFFVSTVNGLGGNVGNPFVLPSGATLFVNSDGSFTYNPNCVVAGKDSFEYQLSDEHSTLSNTAKVYFNISQTMWFVDDVLTNGTGSYNSPFNSLASAQAASAAGDYIFIFPGTYNENITLKNDQKLLGAGVDWLCPSGGTIRATTANSVINGTVTTAMNNTIQGIDFIILSPAPLAGQLENRSLFAASGAAIIDNGSAAGNLLISSVNIQITTDPVMGLAIRNGGALNVTIGSLSSTGVAEAIQLGSCTGSININGGTIQPTNSGADTVINIQGGSVAVTIMATITQANNAPMVYIANHSTNAITFNTGTLNVTNGSGLRFINDDGTYNFNGTTTLNGGTAGVSIKDGSSGTFNFSSGTSITNPADTAFEIGGTSNNCTVNYNGSISQHMNFSTIAISNHTSGTVTFQTGAINATNGNGLQFNEADGSYNFNGTTALNGGDAGVDILNGSAGTFSFSSNTSIANPSGTAFNVGGGSTASITYSGSISDNTGYAVEIDDHDANNITFQTGTINSTGSGIRVQNCGGGTKTFSNSTKTLNTGSNNGVTLSNNTGAIINFTNGGLDIDCTSGIGFAATGGGTVTVQGTGNSITSTTGTALNVVSTTIGVSNLNFQSISSNGGSATGIILDDTGIAGGLEVNGDGSNTSVGGNSSGGTISNKTGSDGSTTLGIGIYLNNTQNVVLRRMTVNGTNQNFGIKGTNVIGFIMEYCTVGGTNGDNVGLDEGSVIFSQLTGTSTFTNCSISGSVENNLTVVNTSGTLDRITVNGCNFGFMSTSTGDDAFLLESNNTAVIKATVTNNIFTHARGDHFQLNINSSSTDDIIFTGNTITNTGVTAISGGGGIRFVGGNNSGINAGLTFNVSNNTMRDARGTALAVNKLGGNGSFSGVISSNNIGVAGADGSGSAEGSCIFALCDGTGSYTANISGNTVKQYGNYGIFMQTGGSGVVGSANMHLNVSGNTVSNPSTFIFAKNGLHLNGGVTSGDTYFVCLNIGANSIIGTGTDGGTDFRLRQRQLTTVRLPGYIGANNDETAVVNFVQGNIGGVPSGSASNNVAGGGAGYINGATCNIP